MIIKFYNNNSDNVVVTKNLTEMYTLNGSLREPCSIHAPIITVESDVFLTCNYCHIPDFNRYYYIDDVTLINNKMFIITCSVDVLMSFNTSIRNLTAVIDRSETMYNLYLQDDKFVTENKTVEVVKNFPNGFNTYSYRLLTIGQGYIEPVENTSDASTESESIEESVDVSTVMESIDGGEDV